MLHVPEGFKLFKDYKLVKQLGTQQLAGTWMSNHKTFGEVDFLEPHKSDFYSVVSHLDAAEYTEKTEHVQWQLLLFNGFESQCDELKKGGPIDTGKFAAKPMVYIFDSAGIEATKCILLMISNFITSVFCFYHREEYKVDQPKSADFKRIKKFVSFLSKNIVHVKMPKQPVPSHSAAYLISNISFLTSGQNLENILRTPPGVENVSARDLKLEIGKKKISTHIVTTTLDASHVYGLDYVDPLFAS